MQLIKITSDKIQIKTNSDQLGTLSVNHIIQAEDGNQSVSLICMVTGITRNEIQEQFDVDGELLEPEVSSTIECSIIGSLVNGKFTKSVDHYPAMHVELKPVSRQVFEQIVSEEPATPLRLGSYAAYDVEAVIDGNRFFQRHSAILGNTGCGKSCTVASILEKAAALPSSNIVVFDIHGEYSNLSYVKEIKIGEGGMDFPIWFLPFRDIYGNLLKIKEESSTIQLAALRKAFHQARRSDKQEDLPIRFTLDEILAQLQKENSMEIDTGEVYKSGAKAGMAKTVKGESNGKLTNLIQLLQDKKQDPHYRFMNQEHPQDYLSEFLEEVLSNREQRVKAINLSETPSDLIPTIIAVLTKLLYRVQRMQDRGSILPLSLICDEAHIYIPTSEFGLGASQRRLLEIFEIIAKEGRKFGTSLMIVSQRPSELNRTIMAQCANYILLKMSNDGDKQMIKSILPESSKTLIDGINLFQPGDCLVVGDSAAMTLKIKVDLPKEEPNSSTIDTWNVWEQERNLDVKRFVNQFLQNESKEE